MISILSVIIFSFIPSNFLEAKTLTLKDAIALVKSNNLEVKSEKFKSLSSKTDLMLIDGNFRPSISTTAGVGPINGKTGNYQGYTEQNTWGAAWIFSLETKIPLYAWGMEQNLIKASQLNTELNELDINKKQNEIIYKLKEAYYGWQYTLSLLNFLNDTESDLNGAIKALEDKKTKKEDILKLEVFKYQVADKKIEVEKNIQLAQMGVSFYIGQEFQVSNKNLLENERQWIEMDQRDLKDLNYYFKIMSEEYPDFIKLKKGLEAKKELLTSEKKSELPKFGALIKYDYAKTDQRTAQNNPFIQDPYNRNDLAAGIGLTWDLDFGIKKSKQEKLNIEIAELQAKDQFAKNGMGVMLNKSYIDVEEATKKVLTLQKAYKSAKKWLTNIESSVALGLTPPKDIVDAYTTRALVYKDYYESIYKYQLAWAKLSETVGMEIDPLISN